MSGTTNTTSPKQILAALGGATVSLLTSSVLLSSAQAATMYRTTFDTLNGDISVTWSGEDEDGDNSISLRELKGEMTVDWGSEGTVVYDVDDFVDDGISRNGFFNVSLDSFEFNVGIKHSDRTKSYGGWTLYTVGIIYGYGSTQFSRFTNFATPSTTVTLSGPAGGGVSPEVASTPEPSLILGFITLGGVMLGSRKKEKA